AGPERRAGKQEALIERKHVTAAWQVKRVDEASQADLDDGEQAGIVRDLGFERVFRARGERLPLLGRIEVHADAGVGGRDSFQCVLWKRLEKLVELSGRRLFEKRPRERGRNPNGVPSPSFSSGQRGQGARFAD